ncbi:phosphotransferase [Gordonia sp. Z-3]|uniref:Phosphotransferase n=2 Tax=Gordonia TaxID=2053 RepID=A0A9X3D5D6_9ACTN|nr:MULTISPECIES: ecdysteroid 22-kinase family protein [Gordonia]MAU81647.1 hypothetical protein [Gordonia sp. (in: high G+C Gram-positive bacteria)]MCF3938801.1 ecdysteroid 22-kinase family protein [Gordonia tangerina]MCX2964579.1 phosphotransferase [Gordonia aquimaris]MED5802445.1 phosphotransferase [Gordonia sp. Z-3]
MTGSGVSPSPSKPGLIPTDVDAVTADFLTGVLRSAGHVATVASVSASPVGSGQMASSFRLSLTYAINDATLPTTMVAKIATGPLDQRTFAVGAFRNEVAFYADIAPTVDVPTPRAYAAVISDAGSEFVLLLEDMAPAEQGDQIAGADPQAVTAVAVAAAGLHAPRWCDETLLTEAGLNLPTAEDADMMQEFLVPMADTFRERFAPTGPDSAALDHLVAHAHDWLVASDQPYTIIHSDLRLDNILFDPDGTATVVDWQTIAAGPPLRDIAFLVSTSLSVTDRRAHERAIVSAYHDALCTRGIADYSAAQCWNDYVDGLLHTLLLVVFGAGAAQPTERGDRMFATMLSRGAAAVADHASGSSG